MKATIYQRLSELATVEHLFEPIGPKIDADWYAAVASEVLADEEAKAWIESESVHPMSLVSIVYENGSAIGYIDIPGLISEEGFETLRVRDVMTRLAASRLISSDTSLATAVHLFSQQSSPWSFFFVLNTNAIVGTLSYYDLFKPMGRVFLLGLTLEIEQLALQLCEYAPESYWSVLANKRKERALSYFKRTFPNKIGTPAEWLRHTSFADKSRMIGQMTGLSSVDASLLEEVFAQAEVIRNACAHTSFDVVGVLEQPRTFSDFVDKSNTVIDELKRELGS